MRCKRVMTVLAVLLVCGGAVRGDLLEQLRDNDERFDNVMVSYDKSYVHVVRQDPFHFTKFGDDPGRMPKDFWEPRTFKFDDECWFMAAGKVSVLSIQFNPTPAAKYNYEDCRRQYHKCGELNSAYYELFDMQLPEGDPSKETPNYEKQLRISKRRLPFGRLHRTQMEIEFVHGIGFGKWITKISSVEQLGDTTIAKGDIELWPDVVSTFVIMLDGDLLVRKATIDLDRGSRLFRTEVATEGTVERDGLKLAKSGTFKDLEMRRDEQGKTGEPKVRADFTVRLRNVETNLTQERIRQLSKFEIDALTQVDDRILDIRGTGPLYMMKNCIPDTKWPGGAVNSP